MSSLPEMVRTPWLAYAALVLSAAIYGCWAIVADAVMSTGAAMPFVFVFYRCIGGSTLLFLALLLAPGATSGHDGCGKLSDGVASRDRVKFLVLGMLLAAGVCCFMFAELLLHAITCSIGQTTIPMLTAVISVISGTEAVTLPKMGAMLVSVAGAMAVVAFGPYRHPGASGGTMSIGVGMACLLLNVGCASGFYVLQKDLLRRYSPVFVIALAYGIATVVIFVVCVADLTKSGLSWNVFYMMYDRTAWYGVLYAVTLSTALNYTMVAWANSKTTPLTVTGTATLQPIFTALVQWRFLGVVLTQEQASGMICVTAGLVLYVWARSKEDTESGVLESLVKKGVYKSTC